MDRQPKLLLTGLLSTALLMPLAGQAQEVRLEPRPTTAGQAPDRPIQVGHDVVDALEDLSDTIDDLLGAIQDAGADMGLADWPMAQTRLGELEQRLAQLQQTLEQKAQTTDIAWFEWFTRGDYTVTVRQQVDGLADVLNDTAGLLAGAQAQPAMQGVLGHAVVGQVDDVRQAVWDLTDAMGSASPQFGGFNPGQGRFQPIEDRLDRMEQQLDQVGDRSDEAWGAYVRGPEYGRFVHDSVYELAQIVRSLFQPDS